MSELTGDWTFIVRRVRKCPNYFNPDGTLTSALFKDRQGVSVNKDHMRNIEDIINDEERLHKYYTSKVNKQDDSDYQLVKLVSVDKCVCDEKEIEVIDDPIPEENPYHCLLFRNNLREQLTSSQARALSRAVKIIKQY